MPFQKVEFEFPHENEGEKKEIEIESSSAVEIDVSGKKSEDDYKPKSEPDPVESEPEIEVVDDTPKADRGRKASEPPADVTDEELADYSEKVRKRIQHFSKGYHDERRAKEAAQRERAELESLSQKILEENKKLKADVTKNQQALLEQAKKQVEAELASSKQAYKQAYESGDSDAVLTAQESLTSAKLRADKLANFKLPALQEEESAVQQEEEQPAPAEPLDPRAKNWAETNTWFGSDDEMTSFALGLHNKLVKEGINPSSDDYYERIDARMRQVFPDNFEDTDQQFEDDTQPQRTTNVVAPATRSTAPKKIRLTQTQLNLAKRLGLTPEQYAKQVALDMRKENG